MEVAVITPAVLFAKMLPVVATSIASFVVMDRKSFMRNHKIRFMDQKELVERVKKHQTRIDMLNVMTNWYHHQDGISLRRRTARAYLTQLVENELKIVEKYKGRLLCTGIDEVSREKLCMMSTEERETWIKSHIRAFVNHCAISSGEKDLLHEQFCKAFEFVNSEQSRRTTVLGKFLKFAGF